MIKEIDKLIGNINGKLKKQISPEDISKTAKIPFKVATIREIFLHRTYDFSVSSRILIEQQTLVPLIILVRSLMETNSIFSRINSLTKETIDNRNVDLLNEEVMIVICGTRDIDEKEYKSKNILTYINKVNIKVPQFREIYDNLSEFVHPNHDGCLGTYGNIDEESGITYLGFDIEQNRFFYNQTIRFLMLNLEMFIHEYDESEKMQNDLVKVCETELKNNSN